MKIVLITICLLLSISIASAQATLPSHSCGLIASMSVENAAIDGAFAPRLKEGSQSQFDCITSRDPNFAAQRFTSRVVSNNYWLSLLSLELGVSLTPLPVT